MENEIKEAPKFKAEIDADTILKAMRSASILVEDVKVNITEDGLNMNAVDLGNVCMVSTHINKKAFSYYDIVPSSFGLDLIETMNFFKLAKKEDNITIEYLDKKSRIKFITNKLNYSMALLNMDNIRKEPKTPELELPVKIVADGKELAQAIKAAGNIGDTITFNANKNGLKISSKGQTSDMFFNIPKGSLDTFERNESVISSFDLDYLKDISRALIGFEMVEIEMGANYPIRIKSKFTDGRGSIEYMLAPRVEDSTI